MVLVHGMKPGLHAWSPFLPPASVPLFPSSAALLPSRAIPQASCSANLAGLGRPPGSTDQRGLSSRTLLHTRAFQRNVCGGGTAQGLPQNLPLPRSRTPSLAGLSPVGRGSPPRWQHREEPFGTPAPRGREPQPALTFATWATSGEPLHLGFEPQFLPL